jgi:hypothetical protein
VSPGVTAGCIDLGRRADALRQIASFIKHNAKWAVAYPSARLRLDPLYDSMRNEPEFVRIVAEVEAREKVIAAPDAARAPQKK